MISRPVNPNLQLGLLWLLVVCVSLAFRPLLPVDETRYLSVAWEMWLRGDFLVPFKNGEPYADKPPLLFWLMHAGWWLFGVNEWWPRLIAPLSALGCLALMRQLAAALWPRQPGIPEVVGWLLFGVPFWLAFLTLVQFDLLLVMATLLAMLGWWRMGTQHRFSWLPGIAIGLGILSKGPVILLHVLPVALLAPLWSQVSAGWWRWYGGVLLSLLIGAVIALAWAIPAGISGGEAYRNAIFWGQTAHRVVNSFAHQQPWWWYLPLLPLLLLPWSIRPGTWKALASSELWQSRQSRFLLAWLVPVLIGFSLVSGKQLKYLLPLLPAMLLLIAYGLSQLSSRKSRAWLAGVICLFTGGVLATLRFWLPDHAAAWLTTVEPAWGILLCLTGLGFWALKTEILSTQLKWLALASAMVVIGVQVALMRAGAPLYDLTPISQQISQLQQAGEQVAHIGEYHAQFNFLGRLKDPLELVEAPPRMTIQWARSHPDDYVVVYRSFWPGLGAGAMIEQDYRGRESELGLWRTTDWLAALPKRFTQPKRNKSGKRRHE